MRKGHQYVGIILNMDYENQSHKMCKMIWDSVYKKMLERGFRYEKRIFVHDDNGTNTIAIFNKAKTIMDEMETHLSYFDEHPLSYIKDFYGVTLRNCFDLTLPGTENIDVKEEPLEKVTALTDLKK